jgi:hypothetical protein
MLNDTYTISDLHAAQVALHGKTVSAGSTPLPQEVRVAEAIAKARDEASRRAADQPQLSDKDRGDVRAELGNLVFYVELDAKLARAQRRYVRAAELDVRASRVRYLLTLFAVLLLALVGCVGEQPPPPYEVHFRAGVPVEDVAVWQQAARDWNDAVGEDVFLVSAAADTSVRIYADEHLEDAWAITYVRTDGAVIRYELGGLRACVALHELAHVLLGHEHDDTGLFSADGCDFEPVVTPELAQRVRERWSL